MVGQVREQLGGVVFGHGVDPGIRGGDQEGVRSAAEHAARDHVGRESREQARDPRAADVRSDLYSLGCTLFFMLTGQPPFPDGTVLQKLLSHSSEEPPDLLTYRPDLPGDIAAVSDAEFVGYGNHEQYFFKDYLAYQPDYMEKEMLVAKTLQKQGYKFIFLEEMV